METYSEDIEAHTTSNGSPDLNVQFFHPYFSA